LKNVILSLSIGMAAFTASFAQADICGILRTAAHGQWLDDGTAAGINIGAFYKRFLALQQDTCVCFDGTISTDGNDMTQPNNVVVTSISGNLTDKANDRSTRCAH
jgi:hypothetical protein